MPLPSIAYRLARVAVGDGLATLTLRPVNALDIAAGHALLLAAGGVLVAEDGTPVTYNDLGESRPSACFGGAPHAVETLRARTWRGSQEPRREPRVTLTWPRTVPEPLLDRAMGCLFGLAIGGDLGPDTELGIVVARALVGRTDFDPGVVEAAIAAWRDAGGEPDRASPLARAVAIGVWASDANAAREAARLDQPGDPDHADIATMISAAVRGRPAGWKTVAAAVAPDTPAHPAMARLAANRPIAAAMSGATMGRTMFPVPQVMRVLTWRPDSGLGGPWSRPEMCWTDDLPELAEALSSPVRRAP